MDQFVAELKKIPPVTRFLTISTLSVTLPVIIQVLSPYKLLFVSELVLKKFELWRLYTSFFLGSTNINFIFEFVMMYRMSDQLESGPYNTHSADYAWQLAMAAGTIVLATRPINSYVFLHSLLACLSYVSSRLAPAGAQTTIMGLVSVPIVYFPYIMVAMDLLMSGPHAAAESVAGIIVGHGWWWTVLGAGDLNNGGPLSRHAHAPNWLVDWYGERRRPTMRPTIRTENTGAAAALSASGVQVIPPRNVRESSSPTDHPWGHGNRLG